MMQTRIPRPQARNTRPKAAVDFPLPGPVLMITRPFFFLRAPGGGFLAAAFSSCEPYPAKVLSTSVEGASLSVVVASGSAADGIGGTSIRAIGRGGGDEATS